MSKICVDNLYLDFLLFMRYNARILFNSKRFALYLKVVKAKGYEYLKFVESYRVGKQVKQRVIANLGRVDILLQNNALIEKLFEKLNNGNYFKLDDLNKDGEAKVYNYGYKIIKKIWDSYKLDKFFNFILEKKEINKSYDFLKTVFSLVINRALKSELSKLGYFNEKDYFIGLNEDLKLHNIYDSLEVLEEIKDELEDYLLKESINLFNRDVTVAFFDVTTLYFESKKEDEDIEIKNNDDNVIEVQKGLRKFGLSKDFKINETQIVLSLLIDKDGIPITFEIYEGNRAETTTLLNTLDRLKKRFNIEKITIVADRGISRWLNLKEIKERGYEYIVAIRFKNQKELEEKILDKNNYKLITFDEKNGYYGYKEFNITQTKRVKAKEYNHSNNENKTTFEDITLTHKIISTYSDKRALKDEKDRNRSIEKSKKRLKNSTAVKKSKYIKILNENEENNNCPLKYEIDLQKIEEDKKYDGFYAIASSDTSLNALKAIQIHKNIYEVENSFRDIKSSLNIRPIYHFKKERIKGHIIVSFLSYFLLKNIEYRLKNSKKFQNYLKENNETLSIDKIVKAINSVNTVKVNIKKESVFIKLKHNTLASKIIDLFKIKLPKNTETQKNFFNFLEK